jgi:RNA polymerase sigma-70 factor (ECF subfamily)
VVADVSLAWDEDRLHRVHRGDRAETRAFVEAFEGPVFAVLSRTFPAERALVEDLAQETFARALRALHRFDPGGPAPLRRWITTIASRLALDELRRRGRRPRMETIDEAATAGPERLDSALAIEQAMARLSPQARVVVAMRLVEGLSEEEAATALGIETGTVKSRLSRARAVLRNLLGATA